MEDSEKINPMCTFAKCDLSKKEECYVISSIKHQAKFGGDPEIGWDRGIWERFIERNRTMYLVESKCNHSKELKKALKEIKPVKFKEENV